MATTPDVRKFLLRWRKRYPLDHDWVDAKANKALRQAEAQWLSQFEDRPSLNRREITALVTWMAAGRPEDEARALAAIEGHGPLGRAQRAVRQAMKETSATKALDRLLEVPGWDPQTATTLLAACRPGRYLPAGERPLRTLAALGVLTPRSPGSFTAADWLPYLQTCRELAERSGISLGAVGQALVAAADEAPALPEADKARRYRR